MSRNVTVGLVQMDCVLMDKKANLEKMLNYVDEAAEKISGYGRRTGR